MAPRNRRSDNDRYREDSGAGPRQPFENFHAGYLRIDEDHLYRTGIRGPKKYALYCIVAMLILLTFANLIVTVTIIGTLRISYQGLEAFEFVPHGRLWRVFYDVDAFSHLFFSNNASLGSHNGHNLTFDTYHSSPNGTTVTTDDLSVISPNDSSTIFSSQSIATDTLAMDPLKLKLANLHVKKLTSRVDETLGVEADRNVYLTGMEGLQAEGRLVSLSASDALTFTSTHGSIQISAPDGVSISNTMTTHPSSVQSETYKLCVCALTGQVFLTSPSTGCYPTNGENPCSV